VNRCARCRSIYLCIAAGLIVFVVVDISADSKRLTSFAGMMLLLLLGFLMSNNPAKVGQPTALRTFHARYFRRVNPLLCPEPS